MKDLVLSVIRKKSWLLLAIISLFLLIQFTSVYGGQDCGACQCWCSDFDNGINVTVKSFIRESWINEFGDGRCGAKIGPVDVWDYCIDADNIREYWCSGTTPTFLDFKCPAGCSNGACNPVTVCCTWQKCSDPPRCDTWQNVGARICAENECLIERNCAEEAMYRGKIGATGISVQYTSVVYGEYQRCVPSQLQQHFCDTDASVKRCCDHTDDCVYSARDKCMAAGEAWNLKGNSEADAVCVDRGDYGEWIDCDANANRCRDCDTATDLPSCSGTACYVGAGESSVGEYDTRGGGNQCCGDDANEYFITGNGLTKCCDNPDNCVDKNGICRLGREICCNGIDDDCDGLIDEKNCPAGEYLKWKDCVDSVCLTNQNEWACCPYSDDCVHISAGVEDPCYLDADQGLILYSEEKDTECHALDSSSLCNGNENCDWALSCSLRPYYANLCADYSWYDCTTKSFCKWSSGQCVPKYELCTGYKTSSGCEAVTQCRWIGDCSLASDAVFDLTDLEEAAYKVFADVNTSLAGNEYCGDPGQWHSKLYTDECTDSDGGLEYFEQGTAKLGFESYTDVCDPADLDGLDLIEYYCAAGVINFQTYTCPEGCLDGACVAPRCVDSDHGKHYYANGTVTKSSVVEKDYCIDKDHVMEYYCDNNNNIMNEAYLCPDSCSNNACECPPGQNFTWRVCASGVCETNISDWACCNSETSCVYNFNLDLKCYTDADEAARLIGNETNDKCGDYADTNSCKMDSDCQWFTNDCRIAEGITREDVKNSDKYHDQVYLNLNQARPGDEFCDPGTWYSEETALTGTVYNLKGTAIDNVKVTAISPGKPVYTDYTDVSGAYYMAVIGNVNYDVSAYKTDYVAQTKSVYTVETKTNITDFSLRYNSICDSDCSHITEGVDDNKCHKDCDGDPNGCLFYDSIANEKCGDAERGVGIIVQYSSSPDQDIVCCEGIPYTPIKALTKVNTTGNVVTIRKPVWYGGKLVNMVITFFD